MKNGTKIGLAGVLFVAALAMLAVSTTVSGLAIISSSVDSSPVGATVASTGNFTTLKLGGAGPSNHLMCGNGTSYVDASVCEFSSGSNSNGWWIKDSTGHLHQWGHISSESTGSCNVITFPVAFTNASTIGPSVTDDFAVGSSIQHSIASAPAHGCVAPSTTQMEDWVSSSGNGGWWTADGY
jgi:hypothetical protein